MRGFVKDFLGGLNWTLFGLRSGPLDFFGSGSSLKDFFGSNNFTRH